MTTATPSDSTPVIAMKDVAVGALQDLERVVLEEVNWTVAAGEYWVVGGMQASGKSDLISLAAGITPPVRGSYRLFDIEMPIFDEELFAQRLRLGMVFDNGNLLHQLSVRENIALPLHYHRPLNWREVEDRVNAMLELTELTPCADAKPGGLPHHLRKRAGLARALMLEPEVLLLDHPLGGLDLRQANWCLNFLDQLSAGHDLFQKRPMTLVVTAADLRPWRDASRHFAVLKQRRFVPLGHCPQLTGHPEPLVNELLAEQPRAAG